MRDMAIKSARAFGLDVRRNGPSSRAELRLGYFIQQQGIDLVLDVGANRGQFASELFETGYAGRIVSFEALPDACASLVDLAASSGRNWQVGEPVALSDRQGMATFHVTDADTSSSLLAPTEAFVRSAPFVAVRKTLEVPTARLDELAESHVAAAHRPFLKIDVQGSELSVLDGCRGILGRIHGVIVEACVGPLYAGQSGVSAVLSRVEESGFDIWDISCGYRDATNYRAGCVDIVGFRPGA